MLYLLSKIAEKFTPKERSIARIAFIACLLSGFFVLINGYYAATEEVPAKGGSFVEGIVGQPTFINPLISSGSDADTSAIELLFPSMDSIAESSTMSMDRKTVSITLKKGLFWDDGKPLTADDVVFTVETMQDILVRSPQAGAWQGVIAEKTNDNEVRLTAREPYAFFNDVMRKLKIVPQHIFGTIPTANLKLSKYNLEPVGAGPWMFKDMVTERNGFITTLNFTANPRYNGPQPLITNFSLHFYANKEAVINAFNTREIDGWGGIESIDVATLTGLHRLISISLPRYYAIFFNPNTHPALKEKNVRVALASAIDRKKIARDAFNDYAATAEGPLTPHIIGYDATVYQPSDNGTAYAKQLLESAGWLINPEDGIRYKTVGKDRLKLEFTAIVPDLPFLTRTMEIVKQEWAAIGAKVVLTPLSAEDMQNGPLKTRNYEMAVFGNILKGNPDVFAFWHSSQKFYPGLNIAMYGNKEVDAILEKIQKAEQPNKEDLKKLQEIIKSDAPAAFLINPNYLYAVPVNLRGQDVENAVTPSDRLTNANAWYMRTKRQFKK